MSKMQLFIKTTTGKAITLAVEGSDTLNVIKAKIKDTDDESDLDNNCDIHWELKPKPKPEPRWTEIGIWKGSLKVSVRILSSGKTIRLSVGPSEKILEFKQKIKRTQGIMPFNQKLFVAGKLMEVERTLAHYNIYEGPMTIDLVLGYWRRTIVETIDGKTVPLKINDDLSIIEMKYLIQRVADIPALEQRLVFDGEELCDTRFLHSYYFEDDSTLRLVDHDFEGTRVSLTIHVQIVATQETIHLDVESTDTIYNVKAMIQAREGIPTGKQVLFLRQKQLHEDSLTLADYFIHNGCTLGLAQLLDMPMVVDTIENTG